MSTEPEWDPADDGDHSAFTHRDDDEPPPYTMRRWTLLEDEDGAPYPDDVQDAHRGQMQVAYEAGMDAALAQSPERDGLDVERLAAILNECIVWGMDDNESPYVVSRPSAERILARLAATQAPETPLIDDHPFEVGFDLDDASWTRGPKPEPNVCGFPKGRGLRCGQPPERHATQAPEIEGEPR